MNIRRAVMPVVCLLVFAGAVVAQPSVYWQNRHERMLAIVPMIGQGTTADPKRPLYVPPLIEGAPVPASNFLGFISVLSDDGTMALVEFVADNVSAFQPMLADPTIQTFLKGRDSRQAAQTAFQVYKKGFSIANFGLRIP